MGVHGGLEVSAECHNFILSVSNSFRFYISGNYSWTCEPIDYSNDPEAVRALNLAWIFYISKFLDMFDSFFFVLKKKFSHLSFLHVYHHGIMPFECWFGARWEVFLPYNCRL